MKFPSHLKCDGKIVSEMGPRQTHAHSIHNGDASMNTFKPEQNGCYIADNISKFINILYFE